MRSELYNGLLEDGRFHSWGQLENKWLTDRIDLLEPGVSQKRMLLLKEQWRGIDEVFSKALDGYEVFAQDKDGGLWLEDKKSGRTEYHSSDNKTPFPDPEYNSVEAAVFVRLLKYASKSADELGIASEKIRDELNEVTDLCEKYFPSEWTAELRRIAQKPFMNGSLLSDEQVRQIREDLCI